VDFNLVNNGGTISPGASPGNTTIHGQLQINSGVLEIELASPTSFDTITATGSAVVGGDLHVRLLSGFLPHGEDVFEIVTGQTVGGSFANLTAGNRIQIEGANASFLVTVANSHVTLSDFLTNLPGDYNNDGLVTVSDYVSWRKRQGSNTPLDNETASPGVVDEDDFVAWRANFGASLNNGNLSAALVPEPSAGVLAFIGAMTRIATVSLRPNKNRCEH